ncbi:hypothetical protein C8J56DRAFT_900062 [Mycena floridula]|nr:hypothetical protein C8J56DRAFT_900062 [Mycena floridula]
MKWLSLTERLHTLSISACLPTGIPNSVWDKLKTLEIFYSRDTAIRVQEELEILRLCTILETYSPQGTITLGVPDTLRAVSMEHLKTLVASKNYALGNTLDFLQLPKLESLQLVGLIEDQSPALGGLDKLLDMYGKQLVSLELTIKDAQRACRMWSFWLRKVPNLQTLSSRTISLCHPFVTDLGPVKYLLLKLKHLTLSMPGEHVIDMTALADQVVRVSSHEWERYTAEIKSRHNTAGIDKLVVAGTQLQSMTVFLRLDQSRKNLDAIAEEWKAEFKATMKEKAQSTVQRFYISTANFARDYGTLR